MTFFVKLEDMLAAKARDNAEKARGMAVLARLDAAIAEEEKRIDLLFKELGRMYDEGASEAQVAGKVEAINAANAKIMEYKIEKQRLCHEPGREAVVA